MGEPDKPVRVFISYAHGGPAQIDSVRRLWLLLRSLGVDAHVDLTATAQRRFWPDWISEQVREATFVLVVASPAGSERAAAGEGSEDRGDRPTGRGMRWEARLLQERSDAEVEAGLRTIRPVVLPGGDPDGLPGWLLPPAGTVYRLTELTAPGVEELMRELTGQPWKVPPPLGPHRPPPHPPRLAAASGDERPAPASRGHGRPRTSRPDQPPGRRGDRRTAVRRLTLAMGCALGTALLAIGGTLAWGTGWLSGRAQGEQTGPASHPAEVPSSVIAASIASRTSAPARPATAADDATQECQAASRPGDLEIGTELNSSGGPNGVPEPCTSIWLTLTEVHFITYARACLEDGDGTDVRCGGWVFLKDNGAWNLLLDDASPGDRWQLYVKAQGPGHLAFEFTDV